MKSIHKIGKHPAGIPLAADDFMELHASRLLLLVFVCGTHHTIEGLTKLAKLDFFVRYPQFFDKAVAHLGKDAKSETTTVESSMIRFHYGPWDKRYYQVLPYLEGAGLLSIHKASNAYTFSLTQKGLDIAKRLSKEPSFAELHAQMKQVKKAFGSKKGTALKELIYKVFDQEVAQKKLGEVIG